MVRAGRVLATAVAVLALGAAPAAAATITVTTTADLIPESSGCSLREAILAVNAPGAAIADCTPADTTRNTIVLGPDAYDLVQRIGSLAISGSTRNLTIAGAGEGQTTIDATMLGDRILEVAPGAGVTFRDLTMTGGRAPGGVGTLIMQPGPPGQDGGAILNQGSLALTDVALTDNEAGAGGHAQAGPGSPGLTGGQGGSGGAIFNTGTLVVTRATIAGDRSGSGGRGGFGGEDLATGTTLPSGDGGPGGNGGAIANEGGTVTVTDSTITGNSAGDGGAGAVGTDGGSLASNGSKGGEGGGGGSGGGVWSSGGSVSITNSTLASNVAGRGGVGGDGGTGFPPGRRDADGGHGGHGGDGGGVAITGTASAFLESVTVADGRTGDAGAGGAAGGPSTSAGAGGDAGVAGGIFGAGAATPVLRDSLLASNLGGNCSSVLDGGHNLTFAAAGCPHSFISGDPRLGALQDNGGPTPTMALRRGSAAINRVPTGPDCPATDQRGVRRPGGRACDIGAYEVARPVVALRSVRTARSRALVIRVQVMADAADARVRVEYGRTTHYGRSTSVQIVTGVAPTTLTFTLRGLNRKHAYHLRIVARSTDGITWSRDLRLAPRRRSG